MAITRRKVQRAAGRQTNGLKAKVADAFSNLIRMRVHLHARPACRGKKHSKACKGWGRHLGCTPVELGRQKFCACVHQHA